MGEEQEHEGTASEGSGDSEGGDQGNILERGGVNAEERAGSSLGIDPQAEPDEETKQEMEEDRSRRLDPENRPDNAEVDNTQRDFDTDKGMFTDSDAYEEADPRYAGAEEDEES